MRRYCVLWIVLFAAPLPLRAAADPVPKVGDLYVVSIGQNEWSFLAEGFDRTVHDQGKTIYRNVHSRLLVGPKATRKDLLDSLDWMRQNARADDLVMVFIGCHGICTRSGESLFATRTGMVRPREIKQVLAKLPCHAIVVNDACGSGNWPKEFPGDPMPPNVTALCCCLATQSSAIEFDVTLFEALYGKADFNKDGIVDLDEVIKYCGLRIKEVQGGKLTPVLHKAKNLKHAVPLAKVNPDLVSVVHQGEIFSAKVQKQDGDQYYVWVIGFNDKPGPFSTPKSFPRANVLLPRDGMALMVKKGNRWQPARLLGRDGADYKVRYLGSEAAEEVVTAERVRHLFAGHPGEAFPVGLFRQR